MAHLARRLFITEPELMMRILSEHIAPLTTEQGRASQVQADGEYEQSWGVSTSISRFSGMPSQYLVKCHIRDVKHKAH